MRRPTSYIILTVLFQKEGERWTAECRELGTATYGDTVEEAKEAIHEAITLHLNTLEDLGECERFLQENGVEIHPIVDHKKPEITSVKSITDIPVGALVQPAIHEIVCP